MWPDCLIPYKTSDASFSTALYLAVWPLLCFFTSVYLGVPMYYWKKISEVCSNSVSLYWITSKWFKFECYVFGCACILSRLCLTPADVHLLQIFDNRQKNLFWLPKLNFNSLPRNPSMNWEAYSAYFKYPNWTSQGGLTRQIEKLYGFPCLVPHSFFHFSGPVIFSCFWLHFPHNWSFPPVMET